MPVVLKLEDKNRKSKKPWLHKYFKVDLGYMRQNPLNNSDRGMAEVSKWRIWFT